MGTPGARVSSLGRGARRQRAIPRRRAGTQGSSRPPPRTCRLGAQFSPESRSFSSRRPAPFRTDMTPGMEERAPAGSSPPCPTRPPARALPPDSFGHLGFTVTSCLERPVSERTSSSDQPHARATLPLRQHQRHAPRVSQIGRRGAGREGRREKVKDKSGRRRERSRRDTDATGRGVPGLRAQHRARVGGDSPARLRRRAVEEVSAEVPGSARRRLRRHRIVRNDQRFLRRVYHYPAAGLPLGRAARRVFVALARSSTVLPREPPWRCLLGPRALEAGTAWRAPQSSIIGYACRPAGAMGSLQSLIQSRADGRAPLAGGASSPPRDSPAPPRLVITLAAGLTVLIGGASTCQ